MSALVRPSEGVDMKRLGMFLLLAVPLSLATLASCMGVLQSTPVNTLSAAIITLTITGTPTIPTETVTSLSTPTPSPRQTPIPSGTPTPTATPVIEATATRAPTATAEKAIFVTSKGNVNFRTGPGTGYGIVTKLGAGASVYVDSNTKKDNGEIWYHGVDAKGNEGWISSTVGEANEAALAVPTAEKTPVLPTAAPKVEQAGQTGENRIYIKGAYVEVYNPDGSRLGSVGATNISYFRIIGESDGLYQVIVVKLDGSDGRQVALAKSSAGVTYQVGGTPTEKKTSAASGGTVGGRTDLRKIGGYMDGNDLITFEYELGYWSRGVNDPSMPETMQGHYFNCGDIQTIDYRTGIITVKVVWDGQVRILKANIANAVVTLRVDIMSRIRAGIQDLAVDDNVRMYFASETEMREWSAGIIEVGNVVSIEGTR